MIFFEFDSISLLSSCCFSDRGNCDWSDLKTFLNKCPSFDQHQLLQIVFVRLRTLSHFYAQESMETPEDKTSISWSYRERERIQIDWLEQQIEAEIEGKCDHLKSKVF